MVERQEITLEIQGIISCGNIGMQHAPCWRILHHKIDGTADSVTLKVRHHGFVNLYSVKDFRREEVKRYETVLVVRTRYFDAVDQSIVVAFVHSA